MNEVMIGQYSVPFVLTAVLGFIFRIISGDGDPARVSNRLKLGLAVAGGILLGLAALQYSGKPWLYPLIVDYVLYGFMLGTSAIGINELQKRR